LFWNAGDRSGGSFIAVPSDKCGSDLFKPMVGRGSAFADIDGDGDLDVVITQIAGTPKVLRNDQELSHHWIRLKLVGTKNNRDAIGAWVKLRVADQTLWRQVMPTRSYFSQSELPITIGLGQATQPDDLEVIWPGGARQRVESVGVDRVTVITEAQ
ncbi:MAG TPA: ASPIC/UnbV domain-containing protein, partial [Clostridia bacterium]|nr:ASPIC/UnbV domain-containing protein [Clostridia bacterium]